MLLLLLGGWWRGMGWMLRGGLLGASRCGLCFVDLRFLHYLGVGSRIEDAFWAPVVYR
jgi:hypothetical protein